MNDKFKDKFAKGVAVLGAVSGEKVFLLAGVTAELTSKLHAGNLIKEIVKEVAGQAEEGPIWLRREVTGPISSRMHSILLRSWSAKSSDREKGPEEDSGPFLLECRNQIWLTLQKESSFSSSSVSSSRKSIMFGVRAAFTAAQVDFASGSYNYEFVLAFFTNQLLFS